MSGPPHISDDYDTSPELLTWSHLNNFMMPKEVKLFSIKTFYCQLFSIKTSLQWASHQHKVLVRFMNETQKATFSRWIQLSCGSLKGW